MEGRKKRQESRDGTGHNKMKGGKGRVERWKMCLADRWRENDPEITLQQVTSDLPGSRRICGSGPSRFPQRRRGGVWR